MAIKSFKITEEVVKAAAGKEWNGREVIALLPETRGDEVEITEEVVRAVAKNWNGKELTALLLEKRGGNIEITEEVVKAAAGNWRHGKGVMALLRCQWPSSVTASIKEGVYLTASTCGQLAVINLLSRHFSHPPVKEEWVMTARFYIAAKNGDVKSIKKLLDEGIYPDTANNKGETPLWVSAKGGNTEVVDLIKSRQVNINARSVLRRPPIFWPSARGFDRIVAILIDAVARTDFVDEEGQTAISMARKHGHCRIVNLLGRLETDEQDYWPVDNTKSASETENQLTPTTTRGCGQIPWALWPITVSALLLFVSFYRSS